MLRSSRALAWLGGSALFASALRCGSAPTQVHVSLSTDVACERVRATSVVAGKPGTTEMRTDGVVGATCTGGALGDLYVDPAEGVSEVAIRATLAVDAAECVAPEYRGCIVARRIVSPVANEVLELALELSAACIGVPCDEGSTCNRFGACVPARVERCGGRACAIADTALDAGGDGSTCARGEWSVAAERLPAPRHSASAAFDSDRGELVVFGGIATGARSDTWSWNGSAWTEHTPATAPPPRFAAGMAYDAERRKVVLFGGLSAANAPLGDTWVWDGSAATWTPLTPAMSPSARSFPALAFDSSRRQVILFGGGEAGVRKNDLWRWDGTTWTLHSTATAPVARNAHGFAFDPMRNEMWMFGGISGATALSDTWVWSSADGTWAQRTPVPSPPARYSHAMGWDSARDQLVVFGGQSTQSTFGDTWSLSAGAWTERALASKPSARARTALAWDNARRELLLTFGQDANSSPTNELWAWNGSTWALRSSAGPSARYGHSMVFDVERGEALLFGGAATAGRFDDTWSWDATRARWSKLTPVVSPPARLGHAMAYDEARHEVMLFGGLRDAADPILADTWTWTGSSRTWTPQSVTPSPPARHGHALAYDARRAEFLLFGGLIASGAAADTWIWSTSTMTWTEVTIAGPPPPRSGHRLVYDRARDRVVLFGGDGAGGRLDDTWEWSGADRAWARRTPAESPAARSQHALIYDAARGEVLLYGGAGATFYDDVWAWDGPAETWRLRATSASPGARWSHALAYDAARSQLVLFGGQNGNALGDTWTMRTVAAPCP